MGENWCFIINLFKKVFSLDGMITKDINRLIKGHITQAFTNVRFDETV